MFVLADVFEPAFDEENHIYYRSEIGVGDPIPSVTQILKPLSDACYKGIPEYVLQQAADLGTAVHACIELYLKDDLDESSILDEWRPYFNAFLKFMRDFNPQILGIEKRLACQTHAGTIDLICVINGKVWIIDWKTTTKLMPMVAIQTAGYEPLVRCFPKLGLSKICFRGAVQLKKDGSYVLEQYTDTDDYKMFEHLVEVSKWIKENE